MDEKSEKFRFPKQLIIIYATIFADSLGYSFVMPILPYYTEQMKGTPLELGIVLSIYAFTQAISISIFNSFSLPPGCIYMGSLSDKFGRKLFIIIALFGFWTGTALFKLLFLGLLFQSFVPTIWLFIIARGYTGLLAGSSTVGQAYIADVVPLEKRANYLSQVGAILSLAYVIGPAFGGLLAEISLQTPLYFIAGVLNP